MISRVRPQPIPISGLEQSRWKELPPSPHKGAEQKQKIDRLKCENEILKKQIYDQQTQIEILSTQVKQYFKIAEEAKSFAKVIRESVQQIQSGIFNQRATEKKAEKGWRDFCDQQLSQGILIERDLYDLGQKDDRSEEIIVGMI
jgi:hypothetical protein